MNEDAIRALVRDIVAHHLAGGRAEWAHQHSQTAPHAHGSPGVPLAWHSSHARYRVISGEEAEGPCFIEPAVRCNHCGYCQSHGH